MSITSPSSSNIIRYFPARILLKSPYLPFNQLMSKCSGAGSRFNQLRWGDGVGRGFWLADLWRSGTSGFIPSRTGGGVPDYYSRQGLAMLKISRGLQPNWRKGGKGWYPALTEK
jgi:hypothetical protein